MSDDEYTPTLNLPVEMLQAVITGGKQYKNFKRNASTLTNLISIYEEKLEDCENTLDTFKNSGGEIHFSPDQTLVFTINGYDVSIPSNDDVDLESFRQIMKAIEAVRFRPAYINLINDLNATIERREKSISLDGISSLAQSIREDMRFAARNLNNVKFGSEEVSIDDEEEYPDDDEEDRNAVTELINKAEEASENKEGEDDGS